MKQKLPPKNVKHARTNTPVSKRSRAAPLLPRRNRTPKVTLVQKEEREREGKRRRLPRRFLIGSGKTISTILFKPRLLQRGGKDKHAGRVGFVQSERERSDGQKCASQRDEGTRHARLYIYEVREKSIAAECVDDFTRLQALTIGSNCTERDLSRNSNTLLSTMQYLLLMNK